MQKVGHNMDNNQKLTLENLIEVNYKALTKSERNIAAYAVKNMDSVYTKTLKEIAKATDTGEATVLRFIKKIGFSSLADFKVGVATTLIHHSNQGENDDPLQVFLNDVHDLTTQTLNSLNRKDLEDAVDLIESAKHFIILGHGSSGFVAEAISYRFMRAGLDCECITDIHFGEIRSALTIPGDVILAISYSGDNTDMISMVSRAKKNGAKIITVTAYHTTTLLQYSDIKLFNAPGSMEHRMYGIGMRGIINQEFLVELLYIIYKQRHLGDVNEFQKETAISTSRHHEYINED